MNYFDSNNCGQSWHCFARDGEDEIGAYHLDNSLCKGAEFNLTELLEDDLPRLIECPWCLKRVLDQEHVRRCCNYKPAYTEEEVRDAYSDPSDAAKLDGMLRR